MKKSSSLRKRFLKGVVSIELMVVFPVVFVLMAVVFDVARVYWAKTVLHQALMNGLKTAEALEGSVTELYSIDSQGDDRYQKYKAARQKIMDTINATPLLSTIKYVELLPFRFNDPLGDGTNSQTGNSQFAYLLPGLEGDWIVSEQDEDSSSYAHASSLLPNNHEVTQHIYHTHVCPSEESDQSGSCSANRTYFADPDDGDTISSLVNYYPIELAAKFKIKSFVLGDLVPEVRVGGYLSRGDNGGQTQCTGTRVDLWIGDGKELSKTNVQCLNDLLGFCQEHSGEFGFVRLFTNPEDGNNSDVPYATPNTVDDCMVGQFMMAHAFHGDPPPEMRRRLKAAYGEHYMGNPSKNQGYFMPKGPKPGNANVPGTDYMRTYFVNDRCQIINRPKKACSPVFMQFRLSPLSLIWNPGRKADESMTVVDFKLQPAVANKWYLWRASTEMPLVVYDPEHTGIIKDGSQLFGSYSFNSEWENGYKALATLDKDGDKKIKGDELSDIGLWFDKNRNGISEEGEVISAKDAGLTTLYTDYDWTDPNTKDVHAALGFERTVGESVYAGASVDWFSRDFWSKTDAITALVATHQQAQAVTQDVLKDATEEKAQLNLAHSAVSAMPFVGVWKWKVEEDSSGRSGGIFTFQNVDESIKGHSFLEAPIMENAEGISSSIMMTALEGVASKGVDDTPALEFSTKDQNGAVVKSTAYYKDMGLVGITSVYVKSSQEPIITYRWTASR